MRINRLVCRAIMVAVFVACTSMTSESMAQVYELRTYTTNEGKLDALNARFRDHTVGLFAKHGIESVGYWVPTDEARSKNTLIYVIRHESPEAAKKSWAAFGADPEWKKVAQESQVDGRILAKRPESVYMELTDYSPSLDDQGEPSEGDDADSEEAKKDEEEDVFELRIYKAAEGKLGKLDARFRDHTIGLFERHGITSIAYWHPTDEPASEDTLIYIIKHEGPDAAKASWKAFVADPDWKAAAAASGVGRLAEPPQSTYMKSTDYSAIQ